MSLMRARRTERGGALRRWLELPPELLVKVARFEGPFVEPAAQPIGALLRLNKNK
jgi:hypothetical protein